MRQDIRDRLIQAARRGEVVFYRELDIGRGWAAGQILSEICEHEHCEGRPCSVRLWLIRLQACQAKDSGDCQPSLQT